jgi:hypothetical protein
MEIKSMPRPDPLLCHASHSNPALLPENAEATNLSAERAASK